MGIQDQVGKMQARQGYRNLWHADLMSTPTADTPYCCYACLCAPCVSFQLRKRALYNNMSRYICCGGFMPCSGKFGESNCPTLCLCTEVCCCFATSVSSTRFLIQDEFNIQTTPCDNCIIGCMLCLNQLACICSLIACLTGSDDLSDISSMINCIADTVFCSVCACMQTQHKIELDKRDGKLPANPVMVVPQMQQMSRMNQPMSPHAGYQHQGVPVYQSPPPGYPQHGGYPNQYQGYPNQHQGYHPQQPPVGYMHQPVYHPPGPPPQPAYPDSGIYPPPVAPPPPPGYVPENPSASASNPAHPPPSHTDPHDPPKK